MRAIFAILPLALFVGACSAQGSVELRVSSTSQGQVAAPPNPGPVPPLPEPPPAQLLTTITRVDVHVDESNIDMTPNDEKDDDSGGWTTIFRGDQRIDLYDSAAVEKTLAQGQAPVGTVSQVRLYLKDDVTLIDSLGEHPVKCPSCSQSGLKLVTSSNVEIEPDGILRLTLDFDSDASLIQNNSGYILKPVVHIAASNE